jgi:hypothetical protein
MSFAINPAIDLVMLLVNSSMKQRISDDKNKTMLKKSCRPENREALAPVPVNIAGCKCIVYRIFST